MEPLAAEEWRRREAARLREQVREQERRARRRRQRLALRAAAWLVLFMGGAAGWLVLGSDLAHRVDVRNAADHAAQAQAAAASLAAQLETWRVLGVVCQDGWPSPSIGKSGACSGHGGVVTVYAGSKGDQLRCPTGTIAPQSLATQRAQRQTAGRLYCSTFY